MKRILRTYLSVILLLCLVVELAPLSLTHTHDNHAVTEAEHDAFVSSTLVENDGYCFNDVHHESSEDECHICKVQQSLNNQAYTLGKQVGIFNFGKYAIILSEDVVAIDDYLLRGTSGRAPPIA